MSLCVKCSQSCYDYLNLGINLTVCEDYKPMKKTVMKEVTLKNKKKLIAAVIGLAALLISTFGGIEVCQESTVPCDGLVDLIFILIGS